MVKFNLQYALQCMLCLVALQQVVGYPTYFISQRSACPDTGVNLMSVSGGISSWDNKVTAQYSGVALGDCYVPGETNQLVYSGSSARSIMFIEQGSFDSIPSGCEDKTADCDTNFDEVACRYDWSQVSLCNSGSSNIVYDWTPPAAGAGDIEINFVSGTGSTSVGIDTLTLVEGCPSIQTITFDALSARDFVESETFSLVASTDSGLTLEYASSNTGVATVDAAGEVTVVAPGTTTITVSNAGDASWAAASVDQNLVINKLPQSITYDQTQTDGLSGSSDPVQLVGTASSGLDLTFSGDNDAVATVSASGLFTPVGQGDVVVEVEQSGDSTYAAAEKVTYTVSLSKAGGAITVTCASDVQSTDDFFTIEVVAESTGAITCESADANQATIVGLTGSPTGSGTVTITCTAAEDDTFGESVGSCDQIISATPQTITVGTIPTFTYAMADNVNFETFISTSSGLPLTFASDDTGVLSFSGTSYSTVVAAGSATVTVTQAGNAEFEPATATVAITVAKAVQRVTFPTLPLVTDGDDPLDVTVSYDSGLQLAVSSSDGFVASVSITGTTLTITPVSEGSCDITFTQAGDANYLPAVDLVYPYWVRSVALTDQVITFNTDVPVLTIGEDFDTDVTSDSGLTVQLELIFLDETICAELSAGTLTGLEVGMAILLATQPGDLTYNAAEPVAQEVWVKGSQTITVNEPDDKVTTSNDFTLQATSDSGLTVSFTNSAPGDVVTLSGTYGETVTINSYGTVEITASQAGDDYYEAAEDVVFSFDVSRETYTIVIDSDSNALLMGNVATNVTAYSSGDVVSVTCASNNDLIATVIASPVTNQWYVEAAGIGEVNITCSYDGDNTYDEASETQLFTVEGELIFDVIADLVYSSAVDATIDLNDYITDTSGGSALTVESSDTAIVSVDAATLIATVHMPGTATLTAENGGLSDTTTVTMDKSDDAIIYIPNPADSLFGGPSFVVNFTYEVDSNAGAVTITSDDENVVVTGESAVISGATAMATITFSVAASDYFNAATQNVYLVVKTATVTSPLPVGVRERFTIADIARADIAMDVNAFSDIFKMFAMENSNANATDLFVTWSSDKSTTTVILDFLYAEDGVHDALADNVGDLGELLSVYDIESVDIEEVTTATDVADVYDESVDLGSDFMLYHTVDEDADMLHAAIQYPTTGWVAFGKNDVQAMVGGHVVLGWVDDDGMASVGEYDLTDKAVSGIDPVAFGTGALVSWSAEEVEGTTTIGFVFDLANEDFGFDVVGASTHIWACGGDGADELEYHADKAGGDVTFVEGAGSSMSSSSSSDSDTPVMSDEGGSIIFDGAAISFAQATSIDGFNYLWTVSEDETEIQIAVQCEGCGTAWIGFAFAAAKGSMVGSVAVIGWDDGASNNYCGIYDLNGKSESAVVDRAGDADFTQCEADYDADSDSIAILFTRKLALSDGPNLDLTADTPVNWAIGALPSSASGSPGYHSERYSGSLNFASGGVTEAEFDMRMAAHGWLMTIGWGILLPTGVFASKFGRGWMPEKVGTPMWFAIHKVSQPLGFVLGLIGFIIPFIFVASHLQTFHMVMGWIITLLGIGQVIGGIFRPHVPKLGEEKTQKRVIFEKVHKGAGWFAVIMAVPQIFSGTFIINEYEGDGAFAFWPILYGIIVGLFVISGIFVYMQNKKENKVTKDPETAMKEVNVTDVNMEAAPTDTLTRPDTGNTLTVHRDPKQA